MNSTDPAVRVLCHAVHTLTVVRDDVVLPPVLANQIEQITQESFGASAPVDGVVTQVRAVCDALIHSSLVFGYVPSRMLFDLVDECDRVSTAA